VIAPPQRKAGDARPAVIPVRAWSHRDDAAERQASTLAAMALSRGNSRDLTPSRAGEYDHRDTAPLSAHTRSFFEPRFGHDFSRVRVRSDEEGLARARSVGASAYVIGQEIVWNGRAHHESPQSRALLAHELAHVAAGHTTAAPETAFRADAVLPTEEQQRDVNRLFNPQQSQGATVPAVTDPAGFKTELKVRANQLRDQRLPGAQAVQASPVSLSTSDLTDVTTIAANRVRAKFQSVLAPGIDINAIRSRIKYIPSDPGTAPASDEAVLSSDALSDLDLSAVDTVVIGDGPASTHGTCLEIINRFHVLPGGRDSGVYSDAIQQIRSAGPAAWRTIALSFRGWDLPALPMLQRHIEPATGEAHATTRRRGRWLNVGTSIHEILHAVTHPDFTNATFATESRRLGTEGFTEFFTRQVYGALVSEAAGNPTLRLSIEGTSGPPAITPPPRTSYNEYFAQVQQIATSLGNEENLRQAYFRGRLEYIGLGHWNELLRGLPTSRRHSFGAAVLLRTTSSGTIQGTPYLRADWGYLVLGTSGVVQLDLRAGAGLTFVGEGDRLGLGPGITGSIRGGHLFLTGGALIQGSASLAGGIGGFGLDTVLRLEAGAQIGRFHVGPALEVLVPITDSGAARRSTQVFTGVGVSFVFGR